MKGYVGRPVLTFPPKQRNQVNYQNNHHQKLQDKRPGLVELLDHELVEVLSRAELRLDQILLTGSPRKCHRGSKPILNREVALVT